MAYPQTSGEAAPQKPSKTGIIWAIVIFVVTAIIGIVMIAVAIGTIANAINDFKSIDAGQTQKVTLGNGDQYVFVGADTSAQLLAVTVTITDSNGNPVTLRNGSSYSSNNNGQRFESLGYIPVSGGPSTYTVAVKGPSGGTVRIGTIPLGRFFGLLFGGIAIGALGFVIALVILIVALVRRSRVKKANRALASGGAPAGAPVYGQRPPPYGQAPPPAAPAPPPAAPAPPPVAPAPAAPAATPPPPAPPAATPPPPAAPAPDSGSWPPPPAPPGPTPPPPGPTPPA